MKFYKKIHDFTNSCTPLIYLDEGEIFVIYTLLFGPVSFAISIGQKVHALCLHISVGRCRMFLPSQKACLNSNQLRTPKGSHYSCNYKIILVTILKLHIHGNHIMCI